MDWDAIKSYKENNPDVVIMDVYMPKTNGIKALQSILQFDKKAKIVMITAAKSKLVRQSIGLGAKDYILKPFDRIIVNNIVGNVLVYNENCIFQKSFLEHLGHF